MIEAFFNSTGYYITGPNVDIAKSLQPLTVEGVVVLSEMQHLYMVLSLVLIELNSIKEDIIIYNDTRIVEDMNGIATPFDSTCIATVKYLKRKIIPSIKGIILFRKKSANYINEKIVRGQKDLIGEIDGTIEKGKIAEINRTIENYNKQNKRNRVEDFKRDWFGS